MPKSYDLQAVTITKQKKMVCSYTYWPYRTFYVIFGGISAILAEPWYKFCSEAVEPNTHEAKRAWYAAKGYQRRHDCVFSPKWYRSNIRLLAPGSGWNGLTASGRVLKELAQSAGADREWLDITGSLNSKHDLKNTILEIENYFSLPGSHDFLPNINSPLQVHCPLTQ